MPVFKGLQIILPAVLLAGGVFGAGALDLVDDGQPKATIIIPDELLPAVSFAADELRLTPHPPGYLETTARNQMLYQLRLRYSVSQLEYGITVGTAGLPGKVTIQKVSSIFSEIGATHGKPG